MDCRRLLWADVNGIHKLGRNISSNRNQAEVHFTKALADGFKIPGIVPGISNEVKSLVSPSVSFEVDHIPGPKGFVFVEKSPPRKVLAGNSRHFDGKWRRAVHF